MAVGYVMWACLVKRVYRQNENRSMYDMGKMEEIRLGTVGTGKIANTILDCVNETEGVRLIAAYSRTEEKANVIKNKYGAEASYTDFDSLLEDGGVNCVYIASPNSLHYEQSRKALLAGKNVICEKPFCTDCAKAMELFELAEKSGLIIVEAVPTPFLPNYEIFKSNVSKVGRIRLVMGNFSQYSSRYDLLLKGETPNVFNPAFAGGCLMDINYYNMYLNVALFGIPTEGIYYPNMYNGITDTSGTVVLRYEDFVSESAGAKDTWGRNYFQIEGESGYIYVEGGSHDLRKITVVTRESEEVFNDQKSLNRWMYETERLTRILLENDTESLLKLKENTINTVKVMEMVRKRSGLVFPTDIG